MHEHLGGDPSAFSETQLRGYFLFLKLQEHWQPKSIRQGVVGARIFYPQYLGHNDWTVFAQIRTRDHESLPAVLTRSQVHDISRHNPVHRTGDSPLSAE
jgi:hypothetical protein